MADKLAPKTKVYKDYFAPVHDDTVKVAFNRDRRHNNDELRTIVMDVESVKIVQSQWGKAKARWRNEEVRRREASKMSCKSATITVRENQPSNTIDLTKVYRRPASAVKRSTLLRDVEKKQYSFRVKEVLDNELNTIQHANLEALGNLNMG